MIYSISHMGWGQFKPVCFFKKAFFSAAGSGLTFWLFEVTLHIPSKID